MRIDQWPLAGWLSHGGAWSHRPGVGYKVLQGRNLRCMPLHTICSVLCCVWLAGPAAAWMCVPDHAGMWHASGFSWWP
jgi:N6-adenosine-specific RNA methylase IME4